MSETLIRTIRAGVSGELGALSDDLRSNAQAAVDAMLSTAEHLLVAATGDAFNNPVWELVHAASRLSPDASHLESLLLDVKVADATTSQGLLSLLDGSITISQPALALSFAFDPDGDDSNEVEFELRGTGDFKGGFSVPAVLRVPAPSGAIEFSCEPALTLSDLAELTRLLGVADFSGHLPAGLAALGGMKLTYLRLELAEDFSRFERCAFAIGCAQDWPIIEDRLTFSDLRINLVLNPGDATGLTGYVLGTFSIGGIDVAAAVTRFDAQGDWRLAVQTPRIPLPDLGDLSRIAGTDVAQLVPEQISGIGVTIYDLAIEVNLSRRALEKVACRIAVNDDIKLVASLPALKAFHAALQLDWSTGELVHQAMLGGALDVVGSYANLTGVYQEGFELSGRLPRIALSQLLQRLLSDLHLPAELPDVELVDVRFSLAPAGGELSVSGSAEGDWTLPPVAGGLAFQRVELEINHTSSETTCRVAIASDRASVLAADFAVQQFHLAFAAGGGTWNADGKLGVEVAGVSATLSAAYDERKTLRFSTEASQHIDIVKWDQVGSAGIKSLSVAIDSGAGDGTSAFAVSGELALAVDGLFDLLGGVEIASVDGKKQLKLFTDKPDIAPLPLLPGKDKAPRVNLDAQRLELTYSKQDDGRLWEFGGKGNIWFSNVDPVVAEYFPSQRLDGYLAVGRHGFAIDVQPIPTALQPTFPPLRLTFANDYVLDLGAPKLHLNSIGVSLGKGRNELTASLRIDIPPELNLLFGWDRNGKPNHQVFNSSFDARLRLSQSPTLTLDSSPISGLEIYLKDGEPWSDWQFGEFAEFSLRTPEFSLTGGRWQGSTKFVRTAPLKLPLLPVKFALKQIGIGEPLLNTLPDAVDLVEVDLDSPALYDQLRRLLGLEHTQSELAEAVDASLQGIEKVVHALPIDFQEYLKIKVPESLTVDFAVGGGGATTFDIATQDKQPLKLLLPAMTALGPTLLGLTFHRISLGQLAGGALAVFEMDGYMDQFDLPMLLGAPALPDKDGLTLRNRFTLTDTLIVAPTALPIPIPLFYKDLGWDLKSITGLEIQTHWSYPKPNPSIFAFITLFSDLKKFFRDKTYLLHEAPQPKDLVLEFQVGRNFVTLPPYLGGKMLGQSEPLDAVNAYESTARLLDAMKTGNLGYLIESIPLRQSGKWIRLGHEKISFGPVTLVECAWCVTTEAEYNTDIVTSEEAMAFLAEANAGGVLETVKQVPAAKVSDKGFVILLMAGAGVDNVVSGRTQFGLAFTHQGGFETGVRWLLEFGGALQLRILGHIQIDGDGFSIAGTCGIYLEDHTFAETGAGVKITAEHFQAFLNFNFGDSFLLQAVLYIGTKGVAITGTADWGYSSGLSANGLSVHARFDHAGMTLGFQAEVFGNVTDADMVISTRTPVAHFTLRPDANLALTQSLQESLDEIGADVVKAIDEATTEIENAQNATAELLVSVKGIKTQAAKQLGEAAAALPGKVRKIVIDRGNSYVSKKRGLKRVAVSATWKTIRGGVLKKVQRELKPKTDGMRALAARLDQADPATAKEVILKALNDTLNTYGKFTYTYSNALFKYSYVYHMPQGLKDLLKSAQEKLNAIDANGKIVIKTSQLRKLTQHKQELLEAIKNGIENDTQGAVPQLRYIKFTAELGLVSKEQTNLTVGLAYKGDHEYQVSGDLTSLKGALKSAANLLLSN